MRTVARVAVEGEDMALDKSADFGAVGVDIATGPPLPESNCSIPSAGGGLVGLLGLLLRALVIRNSNWGRNITSVRTGQGMTYVESCVTIYFRRSAAAAHALSNYHYLSLSQRIGSRELLERRRDQDLSILSPATHIGKDFNAQVSSYWGVRQDGIIRKTQLISRLAVGKLCLPLRALHCAESSPYGSTEYYGVHVHHKNEADI